MIIRSKAPLRLGLAGGGTDVSPYCDWYGGLVLNATISLYTHCTIEEISSPLIIIDSEDSGSKCECELSDHLEIDGEASLVKGVYNRIMKDYQLPLQGFKIHTYNEVAAGSGLGSSSSMMVCILKAFIEWKSLPLGDYEISRLAYEIERHDLQINGGRQDQYAAAFGGFNFMEFNQGDLVLVNPLKIKRWIVDELEASTVLYFTGSSRDSDKIIREQKKNAEAGKKDSIEAMHQLKQSAIDLKSALLKGDIKAYADIIKEGWENKKKMATSITNSNIQEAMDVALAAGAYSGKVSGAGGGGFIMFIVDPVKKPNVVKALSELGGYVMPFQFTEGGAHGWKIYKNDKV